MSAISDFAKRRMETINGQQFVPQGVFRAFIEELDTVLDGLSSSSES